MAPSTFCMASATSPPMSRSRARHLIAIRRTLPSRRVLPTPSVLVNSPSCVAVVCCGCRRESAGHPRAARGPPGHGCAELLLVRDPPLVAWLEPDVELVVVRPVGVGSGVGRTGLGVHDADLREAQHPLADLVAVRPRSLERDPDGRLTPDPHLPLTQLPQQLLA